VLLRYACIQIIQIGHECDLALLTVEEEKFWNDTFPLTFGDVPQLQDSVTVIGYPAGGDNISVTKVHVVKRDHVWFRALSPPFCKTDALFLSAALFWLSLNVSAIHLGCGVSCCCQSVFTRC